MTDRDSTTSHGPAGLESPADDYPSRGSCRPAVLPRKDLVVHSRWHKEAPITEELAALYDFNGYLSFDLKLSHGSQSLLLQEAERIARDQQSLESEAAVHEVGRNELRSAFRVHEVSEVFAKLLTSPRLVSIARFILGDDVYIHQSRLNYKPGFVGKEFYWHSDFETWHVEDGMPRMRALSMSIALCENNEFNGPLMLVPKSHMHFVSCVGEAPADHYKTSLQRQDYGIPDGGSLMMLIERGGIAAPKGPAGSVTVFDCNTMHGSNSNITPYPRSNVFVVYNAVCNCVVSPFGGRPPRPEFLAARRANPIPIEGLPSSL